MKLLITGACGFVGATICETLKNKVPGLKIFGIDNLSRRGSETNVTRLKKLGVKFIWGDVRCREDIDALPDVDFVIDCAANPSVLGGVARAGTTSQIVGHNLTGTLNLIEYCGKRKAGFILLSTSRVYSIKALNDLPLRVQGSRLVLKVPKGSYSRNVSARGIRESFSTEGPLSLYGATKRASEVMAIEYGNLYSFPVWINRSSVLAGAGQFGKIDQGIISYWISAYLLGDRLTYFGYGGRGFQVRDFLHPKDLTELLLKQMKEPLKSSRPKIVNLGGGLKRSLSLAELSAWCDNRLGKKKKIFSSRERVFDVPYYVTDTTLAKTKWGWSPKTSLEAILDESWRWGEKNIALLRSLR